MAARYVTLFWATNRADVATRFVTRVTGRVRVTCVAFKRPSFTDNVEGSKLSAYLSLGHTQIIPTILPESV